MVPSFAMYIISIIAFCLAGFYAKACGHFVDEKNWYRATWCGLLSIMITIISAAILIGGYLVYVAEHTPK